MAAQREDILLKNIPQLQPNKQPDSPRVIKRRIENKPKKSFYTLKMLLTVCGLGIFGLMFIQLYMDSQLNHIHYDIEHARMSINNEIAANEELSAQISELSQYSRIIEVATERGLTLSENIINIER